jgi:hypothetical protein
MPGCGTFYSQLGGGKWQLDADVQAVMRHAGHMKERRGGIGGPKNS